jgi:hypothetical protein
MIVQYLKRELRPNPSLGGGHTVICRSGDRALAYGAGVGRGPSTVYRSIFVATQRKETEAYTTMAWQYG